MAAVRRREEVHISNLPLKEKEVRRRKVKRKKNKSDKAREKLSTIMAMAGVFLVAGLLLYRYSDISKLRYEIVELGDNISVATMERDELNIALGEIKDSSWLVSQAQSRINLRKAEEGQFVSVDVKSPDSKAEVANGEGIKSFFSKMIGKISK